MEINEIETKEIDKVVTKPNVGSIERIVCTHRLHTHSLASTLTLLLRFSCKGKSYQCPAYRILKHSASKASAHLLSGRRGCFRLLPEVQAQGFQLPAQSLRSDS